MSAAAMAARPWGGEEVRRALVYGMGLSGRAATALLTRRGVAVVGVDRRPSAQLAAEMAAELELAAGAGADGFELLAEDGAERLPDGVDLVVLSPGVPPERPLLVDARRRGVPVIAEVELAFPLAAGEVVAITGSNGKSTTTALTGAMLRAAGRQVEVCGNIGRPFSAVVDGAAGRCFVVELSSFQLEGIVTFAPQAAALLNLAPDHLDRYRDLDAYAAAKQRIFEFQSEEDTAILNADDPRLAAIPTRARRRLFSRRRPVADGCYVESGRVVEIEPDGAPRELFAVPELALPGVHNLENAMAAALLARALGAPTAAVRRAVVDFAGLPHRLQRLGERDGVTFFDDSKGTNPAATAKSLEGFADGSVHLILGGRNKGADFAELSPQVERKARRVYLIGEAAGELEAALAGAAPQEQCGTLERALAAAVDHAQRGEVVVLSPACASFDQFRDFVHRGETFQRLVGELVEGSGG